MSHEEIVEKIKELNPDALFCATPEGEPMYKEALIGYIEQNGHTVACYDVDRVIQCLMKDHDMDHDEAVEFFDFNISGACVGENGPAFFESLCDCAEIIPFPPAV